MNFFLYYIIPFIFVLGILIFFHELGHFLTAKYFGVKVLRFSLGFGPKLTGRKVGETEYRISMVPLGGYVKMLGENQDEPAETDEDMERSFGNQHVLKRMGIVAAGPIFNFLLALIIFCLFHMVAGKEIMLPKVGQVTENSPAEKAGLLKGDVILSIEGRKLDSWSELKQVVETRANQPVDIVVRRENRLLAFTLTPEASEVKNIFGEKVETALIGVVASGEFENMDLGPLAALEEGVSRTWEITKLTCLTIVKLIQGVVPMKTLGGPILIGQMSGQLAQQNLGYLFPFMAVISVNLAILNLLPVPVLDGGFLVFLFIELFIGKPLALKKREMAQKVGLFLLFTLMAIVIYNDVLRLLK